MSEHGQRLETIKRHSKRLRFMYLEHRGVVAARIAPGDRSIGFGSGFDIDDTRLVVDDPYEGPYLYEYTSGRWALAGRVTTDESSRVALGDLVWVTLYRPLSDVPGRVAGLAY